MTPEQGGHGAGAVAALLRCQVILVYRPAARETARLVSTRTRCARYSGEA